MTQIAGMGGIWDPQRVRSNGRACGDNPGTSPLESLSEAVDAGLGAARLRMRRGRALRPHYTLCRFILSNGVEGGLYLNGCEFWKRWRGRLSRQTFHNASAPNASAPDASTTSKALPLGEGAFRVVLDSELLSHTFRNSRRLPCLLNFLNLLLSFVVVFLTLDCRSEKSSTHPKQSAKEKR